MSVYGVVQTEINDMQLLCRVLDKLGISYTYDPQGKLSYHKWETPGRARGKDATLVIGRLKGGLDTTAARYCGDTAFVRNPDGTYRVEIDIAHNNAPLNWQKIQNLYAAMLAERNLPLGYTLDYTMDEATGHITGEILPSVESVGLVAEGVL